MSFDPNQTIRGRVWKFGDSVDTDVIYPFYRYPDPQEIKKHTMEALRPEFPREVKPGDILVAGRNFGCGSARRATVLREVGIVAIVAESTSRLLLRNNISEAFPTFVAPGVTNIIEDGQTLEIDYPQGVVRNAETGAQVPLRKYPPMIERLFLAGGILPYARQRYLAEAQQPG